MTGANRARDSLQCSVRASASCLWLWRLWDISTSITAWRRTEKDWWPSPQSKVRLSTGTSIKYPWTRKYSAGIKSEIRPSPPSQELPSASAPKETLTSIWAATLKDTYGSTVEIWGGIGMLGLLSSYSALEYGWGRERTCCMCWTYWPTKTLVLLVRRLSSDESLMNH